MRGHDWQLLEYFAIFLTEVSLPERRMRKGAAFAVLILGGLAMMPQAFATETTSIRLAGPDKVSSWEPEAFLTRPA